MCPSLVALLLIILIFMLFVLSAGNKVDLPDAPDFDSLIHSLVCLPVQFSSHLLDGNIYIHACCWY